MGFVKDTLYALVDPQGLEAEPFHKGLAEYIIKTGGTILPKLVDGFGNALALRFADGTSTCADHLEACMSKYFKPVEPVAVSMPKSPPMKLIAEDTDDNVINFFAPIKRSRKKYTVEIVEAEGAPIDWSELKAQIETLSAGTKCSLISQVRLDDPVDVFASVFAGASWNIEPITLSNYRGQVA